MDEKELEAGIEAPVFGDEDVLETPEALEAARKRRALWPIYLILGVVILAGAAYLGARLLNTGPQGGLVNMLSGLGGGRPGMVAKKLDITIDRAPELPSQEPQLRGMIAEIKDKSLMVASGGNMEVSVGKGGRVEPKYDSGTLQTEVVITGETRVYKDVTFADRFPEDGERIQQVLEEINLSDIQTNNAVSVWGYKRGDRLVAEVILYTQPITIRRGN